MFTPWYSLAVMFDYFNYLRFMINLFYGYLHIFQRTQSFYVEEIGLINTETLGRFLVLPSKQNSLKKSPRKDRITKKQWLVHKTAA